MRGDGGFGGSKSEHTQGTQAVQLEENTSQVVGKTGSERELTRTGPELHSIWIPGKGYGNIFHSNFLSFLNSWWFPPFLYKSHQITKGKPEISRFYILHVFYSYSIPMNSIVSFPSSNWQTPQSLSAAQPLTCNPPSVRITQATYDYKTNFQIFLPKTFLLNITSMIMRKTKYFCQVTIFILLSLLFLWPFVNTTD